MKSAIKRMILGCVAVSLLAVPSFANDVTDDYFDIALNYYKEGNTQKALEYINQILEIEKNNLPALGFKIKLNPPTFSKKLYI